MYEEGEGSLDDQSNQLRARPMIGGVVYPMRQRPFMPMRPAVMKSMMVSRGPARPVIPMGRVVFRGKGPDNTVEYNQIGIIAL